MPSITVTQLHCTLIMSNRKAIHHTSMMSSHQRDVADVLPSLTITHSIIIISHTEMFASPVKNSAQCTDVQSKLHST